MPNIEKKFYEDIREILFAARKRAYAAVNSAMVEAYWEIGRRIVEEEQNGQDRAGYGEYLIKRLSAELSGEFGKGFSAANLKNFRQFYLVFPEFAKSYAASSQLSWTHLRMIMRVDNSSAREYYMKESIGQNWSTRQLERNINSLYYERLLSSPPEMNMMVESAAIETVSIIDFIKDPYVLEFLNLPELPWPLEKSLEDAIINDLQQFLLEMGKGFSFVGRQFRISTETKHFYIDLVFYNYILKCFVLIDLKTGELTHQDIGQMDMYVRMFDDLKCQADDNPTIGIILCTNKDESIVRYSVLKGNEHIFASKYKLVLPSETELAAELERERRLLVEMQLSKGKK